MAPSDETPPKPDDIAGAEGFGDDALMEDFEGGDGTGKGRTKSPIGKVGLVVGGIAAVVAGLILFGGDKEKAALSVLQRPSEVKSTPGAENVPESYKQAVEETNKESLEEAARTGGSALPTPVAPPVGVVKADEELGKEVEDPLARWRRIQEERQKRDEQQKQKTQLAQQPQTDPNAEAITKLSQAMSTQMGSILEGRDPKKMQAKKIMDEDQFFEDMEAAAEKKRKAEEEKRQREKEEAAAAATANTNTETNTGPEPINILVPAASIEYAQLILEANSDVKGPVIAQVMSGPLSGAKIIGDFEVQEEYLTLKFNTAVIDGVSHSIDAIALDPNTTLPGMATDIDHRYFRRIILPAAASFVEGMSSALAQTGGTTVDTTGAGGSTSVQTTDKPELDEQIFKGVEKAGQTLSEIIKDQGKVEPLIVIAAGTPMNILFLTAVTDENM